MTRAWRAGLATSGTWPRAIERHARLVSWLAVLGWLAYIAGAIASGQRFRPGWLFTLFLIFVASSLLSAWVGSRRRMAIREGRLPVLAKRKLRQQYPQIEAKDADLVERAFRQFFMACSRSDGKYVAMPSKALDAYWHAFILDTKSYAQWCERTLGRFLHHVPAERLGSDAATNDGLRRAWFFACKEEAINPRRRACRFCSRSTRSPAFPGAWFIRRGRGPPVKAASRTAAPRSRTATTSPTRLSPAMPMRWAAPTRAATAVATGEAAAAAIDRLA